MHNPTKPTVICLRISSIIYLLIGIICILPIFIAPQMDESPATEIFLQVIWGLMCLVCFALFFCLEIIIKALRNGKYWAWIAGLCFAGLYIPSGFMVLGIIMLINLLKEETKDHCKNKEIRSPE